MALGNLPIAANGLPLVPIGNDMWESLIINESFRQGVFPDNLKVGMVYPIHKVDSEIVCSNYRPISILLIFGKLLEKLMQKRLSDYLNKCNILYDHQFWFQKGKSSEHAALDLYANTTKAIKKT